MATRKTAAWMEASSIGSAMRSLFLALVFLSACREAPDGHVETAARLLRQEKFEPASEEADKAIALAQGAQNPAVLWRARLIKAEALLDLRLYPKANDLLESVGQPESPLLLERARFYLLLGEAKYRKGEYAKSEKAFDEAARCATTAGSPLLIAQIRLKHANLLRLQNHVGEAEAELRQVMDAAETLNEPYLGMQAAGDLGVALVSEHRFDEAVFWFETSKVRFQSLGAATSVNKDEGNAGLCYQRLGDLDSARASLERAKRHAPDPFQQQMWTGNLANVDFYNSNFQAAAQGYQEALEIARQIDDKTDAARWLSNLASTYIELGKLDEAEEYNRRAFELKHQTDSALSEIFSVNNQARIALRRGNLNEAEQLFGKATTLPSSDPTEVLEAHGGLAEVYRAQDRTREAKLEFQTTLADIGDRQAKLLRDQFKLSYLSSLIRFYQNYVDFLSETGDHDGAVAVAESSRSRVLASRIGKNDVLETRGAQAYRKFAGANHTVLLEYWLGRTRSYLWVVSADEIRNFELPSQSVLSAQVARFNAVIQAQRDPLNVPSSSARELSQELLSPALGALSSAQKVVIIPDGALYGLNFEALPSPGDAGKPWIESVTLSVAPSLDYLISSGDSPRPTSKATQTALLIGDPHPADSSLPPLEFAGKEIASISAALPKDGQKVLRGDQATPTAYTADPPASFDLIHFAAHAVANREDPLDSAVILSGAPASCKLFARDVMAAPLNARLVTISACRSAGSKTYAGEGLVGFAWAFLRAGARNVIAGLWDVNDQSTALLMQRLYSAINDGVAPAEALRQAKLSLIHAGGSYAKPYYWAPFELFTREGR